MVAWAGAGLVQVDQALGGELWPVLRRAEQRLREGVVVAHRCPRVRRFDAQPVQHRQHRRHLELGAVVPVKHRLGLQRGDALAQRRTANEVRRVRGVVAVMNLPAHGLATVEVEHQVQPPSGHRRGQVVHVPAPNLARPSRHVVVGGRVVFGALVRPRSAACPCARSTRAKRNSPTMAVLA